MPSFRSRKWLLRTLIAVSSVVALALIVFFALPPVARWQIETQLKALGAKTVEVEGLRFNPFKGEISVARFRSVGPNGEDTVIKDGRLRISLAALIGRSINVREFTLKGADIDIRQKPDGRWTVGGFSMGAGKDTSGGEPDDSAPWEVNATGITVENGHLTLAVGKRVRIADIDLLQIGTLSSSRPDEPASVELRGRTADGTVSVSGTVFPFAENQRFSAAIKIAGLDTNAFEDLLTTGRMRGVSGKLNVDGRLGASQNSKGEVGLSYSGTIDGARLELRSGLFLTRAYSLSWEGDAEILLSGGATADLPGAVVRGKATAKSFEFENLISHEQLSAGTAIFDLSKKGVSFRPNFDGKGVFQIIGSMESSLDYARFVQPDAELDVAPRSITWNGDADIRLPPATTALSARLSGTMSTERFTGKMGAAGIDGLNAESLRLDYSDTDLKFDGAGGMTATGSAKIQARGFEIQTPRNGFSAKLKTLRSDGARGGLARSRDGALTVSVDGPLTAAGITAEGTDSAWQTEQDEFSWKGAVEFGGKADGAAHWHAKGALENTRAHFAVDSAGFEVAVDRSSWAGEAGGTTEADSLVVTGDNRVAGISAKLAIPEPMNFRLEEAALLRIDIKDGVFGLGEFSIEGFNGAPADDKSALPVAVLRSLVLKGISMTPGKRTEIASIVGIDGEVRLTRDESGRIALPGQTPAKEKDKAASGKSGEESPSAGQKSGSAIGSLHIGSGDLVDSSIAFTDRSVTPVFSVTTKSLKASVRNFDSAAPEKPATVALDADLNGFGTLKADGTLGAGPERLNADLKVAARNIELFRFNPYITQAIGRSVRQGRADSDIDLRIADGRIKAETKITINKLKLQRVRGKAGNTGGPPVETAIGLLENDSGVIQLSIPVSGALNDPKFDLSDAIGQAVGGALKETMFAAMRIAFPLGAVVAIVDGLGNTEIAIKPLVFLPGSAAITPALDARIDEVARFIRKTDDVSPALCGIATAEDIAALKATDPAATQATALTLAQKRSDAVRQELVTKYNIPSDRLYDCAASFRGRNGAVPAVAVRL